MRKALLFADLLAFCDFVRTRESLLDPMRAEVRLGEGRLTVRLDGKTHELAIRGQSREPTLLALIRPVPWTREPETRGHLLFRLRHGRLMAPLVTASLRLGNDRMRYAGLDGPGLGWSSQEQVRRAGGWGDFSVTPAYPVPG